MNWQVSALLGTAMGSSGHSPSLPSSNKKPSEARVYGLCQVCLGLPMPTDGEPANATLEHVAMQRSTIKKRNLRLPKAFS